MKPGQAWCVICSAAVLLAEGSHAFHVGHPHEGQAVARLEVLAPNEHTHQDARGHVLLISRSDLMAQTTGTLLIDVADRVSVTDPVWTSTSS